MYEAHGEAAATLQPSCGEAAVSKPQRTCSDGVAKP